MRRTWQDTLTWEIYNRRFPLSRFRRLLVWAAERMIEFALRETRQERKVEEALERFRNRIFEPGLDWKEYQYEVRSEELARKANGAA